MIRTKTLQAACVALLGTMWFSCLPSSAGEEQERIPTNHPSIICFIPVFNFGTVDSDAVVKHSYVITNQGTHLVRIMAVRASCGCTTAIAATNSLAPGQSTTVDVVIDFRSRYGRQSKTIYIESDDPENKVLRMEFNGIVNALIEIQPQTIHFGSVVPDGRLEDTALLVGVSTNTFNVLKANSDSTEVSATVETRVPGKQYLIKVANDGPRKKGNFMALIKVETDHPKMKLFSIPVAWSVEGDIVHAPFTLILVPSATNQLRSAIINLWSPTGKSFKVTKVDVPDTGMTNSIIWEKPDRTRLTINTCGPLTSLNGKSIRIETDLASMKEIMIPIRILSTP